jgi:hypothetical protein
MHRDLHPFLQSLRTAHSGKVVAARDAVRLRLPFQIIQPFRHCQISSIEEPAEQLLALQRVRLDGQHPLRGQVAWRPGVAVPTEVPRAPPLLRQGGRERGRGSRRSRQPPMRCAGRRRRTQDCRAKPVPGEKPLLAPNS